MLMGGSILPLQNVFLAAIGLLALVGIGREINQVGYLIIHLYLIANPYKGVAIFGSRS